jgi:sulfatase modifying factor 1
MRQNLIIVEKQSWSPVLLASCLVLAACTPVRSDGPPPDAPLPEAKGARASPDDATPAPSREQPQAPAMSFVLEAPQSKDDAAPCPSEMILVDGMYCPNVKQTCVAWVDPPTSPYPFTRCAEWKNPATCDGAREHRRYCIDREEFVRAPDTLPLVHASWTEADASCTGKGARLCSEAEWQFACEGEEMRPYPYGWKRDNTLCNFDRTDLGKPNEGLTDHRFPADAFPRCVSPFGVHDMVGNVDEWTLREGMAAPNRSALHGGWWLPGRNNCRQATLAHAESYLGPQVGFRCCRDADLPE